MLLIPIRGTCVSTSTASGSPRLKPHRRWYRGGRLSLPQRWIHVLERGDCLQEGCGFVFTPRTRQRIEIIIGRQRCPTALPLQAALQQLPGDALHTDTSPPSFFHEPTHGGIIDILNRD